MIRFTNDYSEGCHPSILEAMAATNTEGNPGYSTDPHSAHAHELIRQAIGRPDADVHLLVGGTQTNATAIAAFLRPYEAAIAAASGHICVHETGAIEATGHKCIACPAVNGKLTPDAVRAAVAAHPDEHMVKPKLVYISQTTEIGTLYSLEEIEALRAVCDELGLWLYLDGARLACGLAAGGPLPHRPGPPVRRLLHRRHQERRPLRRGPGDPERRFEARLPLQHQAAGRHAGQGLAAGHPV